MFSRKKKSAAGYPSFDRINQIPVLRCSICTGERVACFRDRQTGHVEEVMYIREDSDLREFLEHYGLSEQDLKKEWSTESRAKA